MYILLFIFILFPIGEMMLLIEIGSQIGALVTVILVILTALIGLSLIRQQGASTMLRAKDKLQQGTVPANEILETVMLGLAGVLLLLPGFISDTLGALLILPFFRKTIVAAMLIKFIGSRVNIRSAWNQSNSNGRDDKDIIEGEIVDDEQDLINKK